MIEKFVLRWSVRIMVVVAILTLAFLFLYPNLHARYLLYAEQSEYENLADTEQETKQNNISELVEAGNEIKEGLQVELPEDVTEDAVSVDNDYLTQTITVKFATDCSDYFGSYHIRGSSDNISNISYERNNGIGCLSIGLSSLMELSSNFSEGAVNLTFTDPHDIYDAVIVVDAGHGKGSVGGATMGGVDEMDINLAIVKYLKKQFDKKAPNIGVYYTRLDDSDPTFMERVGLANAAKADLFLSVHNNAYISNQWSSANGTSVLYSESDSSGKSKDFAQICLAHLTDTLGSHSRGVVEGDNIYIVRSSEVPVALVEVGFMTNRSEFAKLTSKKYQKKAAKALYQACIDALEQLEE